MRFLSSQFAVPHGALSFVPSHTAQQQYHPLRIVASYLTAFLTFEWETKEHRLAFAAPDVFVEKKKAFYFSSSHIYVHGWLVRSLDE
jgi:hypothetical protein